MNETPDRKLKEFLENADAFSFGIITKEGYKELARKFDAHSAKIERRFHRWFVTGLIVFAFMGAACTAGLIGFSVLLSKQSHFTQEIQHQRKTAIGAGCEDQNDRNATTITKLNEAVKNEEKKHKSLKAKMKVRNNAEVSIGLINALAPHQDCKQLVREATGK